MDEITINDLYLEYINSISALETDRYFQYLFEMIQSSENTIEQTRRILHKVVDERWLGTIEDSLDALNRIIEKPRRFIATREEVVPVALAKKITADSVRHLSMNTQFIASNNNGEIQPTRILNVSTEESYDLYENRFIYHLIHRLVAFIDKRTDVIFWQTGDDIENNFKVESKIDDAYEQISYKLEMKVKNKQSFAENDSDNMAVFMRIDRVRRLVMSLRHSAFYSLMDGCAKVRSPIQRTNLLMKDPDYRTCYKLWQFLESYDEVGYTILKEDTALQFDEEYLIQVYTNLITNYTVFKSLIEDPRTVNEELLSQHRRTIKPKFLKEVKEKFVNDFDIPDVEVRLVYLKEVTEAQLEAEAKLKEALEQITGLTALKTRAEKRLEETVAQCEHETQEVLSQCEDRIQQIKDECDLMIKEAADDAEAKIDQAKQEAQSRAQHAEENANKRIMEAQIDADQKILAAEDKANAKIQNAQAEIDARVQEVQDDADERIAIAEKEARESNEARIKAESVADLAVEERAKAEQIAEKAEEARVEAERIAAEAVEAKEAAEAQSEADRTYREEAIAISKENENVKAEADRLMAEAAKIKADAEAMVNKANKRIAEVEAEIIEMKQAKESAEASIKEYEEAKVQAEAIAAKDRAAKFEAEQFAQIEHQARVEAEKREKEAGKIADKAEKARKKAEAKADDNRLKNRIMSALISRKSSDDSDGGEE